MQQNNLDANVVNQDGSVQGKMVANHIRTDAHVVDVNQDGVVQKNQDEKVACHVSIDVQNANNVDSVIGLPHIDIVPVTPSTPHTFIGDKI